MLHEVQRKLQAKQNLEIIKWLGANDASDALRIIESYRQKGYKFQIDVSLETEEFMDHEGSMRISMSQVLHFSVVEIKENNAS